MENVMQKPNEVNGPPRTTLGPFKQGSVLVHSQGSG